MNILYSSRQLSIPVCIGSAVALIFLSQSLALAAQVPASGGRIEGVVLRAGGTVPQPVVGAQITVTKVNDVTGASLPIRGGTPSPSIGGLNFGNVPFPGMPGIQIFQADGQPRPVAPAVPPPPQTTLPIPPVTTDGDGRFVVPDLEEGAYRLLITQSGYVRQEFGQRVFPGQGTLIHLTAGQVLRNITMHLTPTGNVGGRLVDNNGQPAVGVNLQLLKTIYNINGQRIFQSAGNARTNDRGEYRFFWVTPGRYYVAGGSAAANFTFGGGTGPNDPGDIYVLTYYPGVTDINRATPVDVKSGSELGVDFVTAKQRLYTISGKVVGTGPAAGVNGQISGVTLSLAFRLLTGNAGAFTMMQAYDPATGTFVMRNVSQIDGIIVDDRGQPVSGVQAVLIPDNRSRSDLYKTATTDQVGRFMMRGIAPGDYKLFAWEAMENYGYFDSEVMRRSDILGKAVRVEESSRLSVEGRIIPAAP